MCTKANRELLLRKPALDSDGPYESTDQLAEGSDRRFKRRGFRANRDDVLTVSQEAMAAQASTGRGKELIECASGARSCGL